MANLNTMGTNMAERSFTNVLVRKLNKIDEIDRSNSVTYLGVTLKAIYFLLLMVVGFAGYEMIKAKVDAMPEVGPWGMIWALGIVAALIFMILGPILAFIIKPLVPVLGSLFCLSSGYVVAALIGFAPAEYTYLALLAAAITVLLVFAMAILYMSGLIKVTQKFKAVICTLFFTGILLGILMFVGSLIPATSAFFMAVADNMAIGIIGSIVFIVIACLMLIVDFDAIRNAVDRQLPKKYEWIAAFALVYTVINLYLKIFSLLSRIKGK